MKSMAAQASCVGYFPYPRHVSTSPSVRESVHCTVQPDTQLPSGELDIVLKYEPRARSVCGQRTPCGLNESPLEWDAGFPLCSLSSQNITHW